MGMVDRILIVQRQNAHIEKWLQGKKQLSVIFDLKFGDAITIFFGSKRAKIGLKRKFQMGKV